MYRYYCIKLCTRHKCIASYLCPSFSMSESRSYWTTSDRICNFLTMSAYRSGATVGCSYSTLYFHWIKWTTKLVKASHGDYACNAVVEHQYEGTEVVPEAEVVYPEAVPVLATPVIGNALLNHWRWGHLDNLYETKKCTIGLHGAVAAGNCQYHPREPSM